MLLHAVVNANSFVHILFVIPWSMTLRLRTGFFLQNLNREIGGKSGDLSSLGDLFDLGLPKIV